MLPTFRSTNLKTATWLLWQRSTRVSIARKLQWRRVELQLKTPTNTGCSGDGQTLSCPLGANTSRPWHSVRENRRCADWSTNYCQSTGQSGGSNHLRCYHIASLKDVSSTRREESSAAARGREARPCELGSAFFETEFDADESHPPERQKRIKNLNHKIHVLQ